MVAWPYLSPVFQSRNLWAAISLMVILLFISGHMFNHIRKVPYVTGDGRGGINYIVPGFQQQLGLETQIVAALCMSHPHFPTFLLMLTATSKMASCRSASSLSPLRFRELLMPRLNKSLLSGLEVFCSSYTAFY